MNPPRNSFRVYRGKNGKPLLDFIQYDGRVFPVKPPKEVASLKPGFYSRDFRFIQPDLTGEGARAFLQSKLQQVKKGHPEYDDNQARGPDGKWTSGGGSVGMTGRPPVDLDLTGDLGVVKKELESRFPNASIKVQDRGDDIRVSMIHSDYHATATWDGAALEIFTLGAKDSPEGNKAAVRLMTMFRQLATDSRADKIDVFASDEFGGYIWPRLGFNLVNIYEVRGLTRSINRTLATALKLGLPSALAQKVGNILAVPSGDLGTKIAHLDDPVDPVLFVNVLKAFTRNPARGVRKPTLGKMMLMGTASSYTLPRAKFGRLSRLG